MIITLCVLHCYKLTYLLVKLHEKEKVHAMSVQLIIINDPIFVIIISDHFVHHL